MKLHRAAMLIGALAAPAAAQESQGSLVVSLGDGTSVPLSAWSLSYEYGAWKPPSSPALIKPARRDTTDLWLAKRSYATAGSSLEIQYEIVERQREVDGALRRVRVPVPKAFVLSGADGKKTTLKPEAPHRDFLLPGGDKELNLVPRSLDIRGQTLTGTKRLFCVVSFSSLVECATTPAEQVLKVEFQK